MPPTRWCCRVLREIANPTENTFKSQIQSKVYMLESLCNDKLQELTNDKIQDWRFHKTFAIHNSSLPTMYVMLKTHKLDPDANMCETPWDSFKVSILLWISVREDWLADKLYINNINRCHTLSSP